MNFAPAPVRAGRPVSRNLLIAGGVVAFHVAALWGLQSGLLRRAVEVVVPVELLSQLIEPPKLEEPPPPPPAPPKPPPPPPVRQPVPRKAPVLPPPPMPAAIPDPTPAPAAPVGVVEPQPPAPPISAPVEIAAPPPAPPAPEPRVELPSSDADYLQNPTPVYPAISRRLGEQGRVMVRVLIGADGLPQRATVRSSSGFQRLDQAATDTVMRWRFVPGKRGGVPEAMWFNVPINFVLE